MPSPFERYTTHHQSRRLDDWDYTDPAAYFVTICTNGRARLFGTIDKGRMVSNAYGRIAADEWVRTGDRRDRVELDAFIVMPNHVHGIVIILPDADGGPEFPRGEVAEHRRSDMARHVATLDESMSSEGAESSPGRQFGGPQAGSLGTIVGAYKSAVTRRINQQRRVSGESVWQRNYHDHVIRNDEEWHRIRRYIRTNPTRWHSDPLCRSANA